MSVECRVHVATAYPTVTEVNERSEPAGVLHTVPPIKLADDCNKLKETEIANQCWNQDVHSNDCVWGVLKLARVKQ